MRGGEEVVNVLTFFGSWSEEGRVRRGAELVDKGLFLECCWGEFGGGERSR